MSAKFVILYNLNKSANEGKVSTLNEGNENIYMILKEFGAPDNPVCNGGHAG